MTKNHFTLHEGKLARNGRQLSMTHYEYVFDEVYGDTASNLDVCKRSVEPLLSWAVKGNQSSVLCFGQTGTGKTYTLYGALEYISTRLLTHTVRITFYEVHGKKCYDLLAGRTHVHLRSDGNDTMHVRGARQVVVENVQSSKEIMEVLQEALTLRSSEKTERNPISSRSHAVCTIEKSTTDMDPFQSCGRITLVDLAGSERNYETVSMTAQQHKESADINFALMALKDCFRAYHQQLLLNTAKSEENLSFDENTTTAETDGGVPPKTVFTNVVKSSSDANITVDTPTVRIPYRSSLLTKVLKDCFTLDSVHRTTIIATVSPTPVDLQHSLNTIAHVILMSPTLHHLTSRLTVEVPMATGYALSTTPVSEWTAEQVGVWLGIAENGRFSHVVLPPKLDGQGLLKLTATNLAELFTTQQNTSRRHKEGSAWVVSAEETEKQNDIASLLWSAVRREQQSALVKIKIAKKEAESRSSDLGRFTL
eukprot:gene25750-32239_t